MNLANKDINIFVSCHKNIYIPNNKYLKTIQVGRLLSNLKFASFGDDSGENISSKNKMFCELTAQYWAWKNVDCEYYGFFHYRRFLSFSKKKFSEDASHYAILDNNEFLDDSFAKKYKIFDEIEHSVKNNDVILPLPIELEKIGFKSVLDHHLDSNNFLQKKDIDSILKIIKKLYPDYYNDALVYLNGNKMILCNMFVMKKDLFFKYSSWLFDILFEFEKQTDFSEYSIEMLRTPGHLAERLLGIFWIHLLREKKYKISYKQIILFNKVHDLTDNLIFSSRKAKKDECKIYLATNENYSSWTAATLQSIIENSTNNHNYLVVIINTNLTEFTKQRFRSMVNGKNNFCIGFYDPISIIGKYNLYELPTVSKETYYRLLIPYINEGDKALYIDSDIIVNHDLYNLYEIDIESYFIAGVRDAVHAGNVNCRTCDEGEYFKRIGLKDKYNYFNAGVILINCKKFKEKYSCGYVFSFAEKGKFKIQDQDVLNLLCQDNVKFLEYDWNVMVDPDGSIPYNAKKFNCPYSIYNEWQKSTFNPKIIHYAALDKPWITKNYMFFDAFWNMYKKTPFFNDLLFKSLNGKWQTVLCNNNVNSDSKLKSKLKKIFPLNTKRGICVRKIYHKLFKK